MVEPASRQRFSALLLNILVAAGGIIVALPLVWMVTSSFKPLNEIYAYPPTLIPQEFTTRNYDRLFSDWPFWNWYGNSLIIAVISTVAVLFFTSLAGFGFAKYRFKGSRLLFIVLLASTMIPFQLILVPLYIVMSRLSWTNSYFALIIPFMAPALGIFLMRQFMVSIPTELIEAARIDGASEFGIYWRVMLPLARPALAAQAVLTFLASWNSFLWPLAVLRNRDFLTLPVGLSTMIGSVTAGSEPPVGATMAAATLVSIPVILVFVAVQKQYVAGLTAASVKE
ncbi:MAG: carbohydrate ABC transporter permease [Chloroflexi bacterium]|nr:carbohydrate ABC transporter permease [Chloroflexota bacterium]MCC6891971.1 carbohydrate ABC transporter permease [Anaerolineae bacterium]